MLAAVLMIVGIVVGFSLAYRANGKLIVQYVKDNLDLQQAIADLREITPRRLPNGRFAKREG